jgi:hypothetical protein
VHSCICCKTRSQEAEYASAELPGTGIFWYQNNSDPIEEFQLFNS